MKNIMRKQIKWIFSEYPWEKTYHINGYDGDGEIIIYRDGGEKLFAHRWLIGDKFVADFLSKPELKKEFGAEI